jgi:hypothetical protein
LVSICNPDIFQFYCNPWATQWLFATHTQPRKDTFKGVKMAIRVKLTKDRVNKMLAEYKASGSKERKDVYDTEIKGFLVRLYE